MMQLAWEEAEKLEAAFCDLKKLTMPQGVTMSAKPISADTIVCWICSRVAVLLGIGKKGRGTGMRGMKKWSLTRMALT